MKRKIIFTTVLLVLSNYTYSQNWVKYGSDNKGDTYYIDTDSTKLEDGIIYFFGLRDLVSPDKNFGSMSSFGEFKVDCLKYKTMLLNYKFFSGNMAKGNLIHSFSVKNKVWFYPPPNTIGDKQIKFICDLNSHTPV